MEKATRSIYIDKALSEELEKEAVVEGRSFNNHIVNILKNRKIKEGKNGEKV